MKRVILKLRRSGVIFASLCSVLLISVFFMSHNFFIRPPVDHSAGISVTYCVVPHPIRDSSKRNLYELTMSSWIESAPDARVLILMPRDVFDVNGSFVQMMERRFGSGKMVFSEEIQCDEDGIPYIDDWFVRGFDEANSTFVVWINSDIIVPSDWYPRMRVLSEFFSGRQFGVITRRCDFDIEDYSAIKYPYNYDVIASERKLHSPWGVDLYAIKREPQSLNIDEIPPFHMGRYRWDPWITGWLDSKIPIVSLGEEFCDYHVNHKPQNRDTSQPKVKENYKYANLNGKYLSANNKVGYQMNGNTLYHKGFRITSFPDYPQPNAPAKL